MLASSTAGYQLLSCATSWHRCRVRRDAGRVQTAGCSAKADAASQVPSMAIASRGTQDSKRIARPACLRRWDGDRPLLLLPFYAISILSFIMLLICLFRKE